MDSSNPDTATVTPCTESPSLTTDTEAASAPFAQSQTQRELLSGLQQTPKRIDPKFFYDERGSELFARIMTLSEYYPSRTEIGIFKQYARDIAQCVGPESVLIEPGAGNCEKVRYLLDALQPRAYIPIDISIDFLHKTARELREQFPALAVHPAAGDFNKGIDLPISLPDARHVVFYPGSTIGNAEPEKARDFLKHVATLIGPNGGLIVGVDLQKDDRVLNAAYNDAQGITAAFNKNVLLNANKLIGADFDPEQFDHRAFYNDGDCRIEMHLESREDQAVYCGGQVITLRAGERIHTENSYKYTVESFCALAASAGLKKVRSWLDDEALFSVHYLEVA